MSFTSSVLSANNYAESKSIVPVVEKVNVEDVILAMMTYGDALNEADIEFSDNYYGLLTEECFHEIRQTKQTDFLKRIGQAIKSMFEAIINLFKRMIAFITSSADNKIAAKIEDIYKHSDQYVDGSTEKKKFTMWNAPTPDKLAGALDTFSGIVDDSIEKNLKEPAIRNTFTDQDKLTAEGMVKTLLNTIKSLKSADDYTRVPDNFEALKEYVSGNVIYSKEINLTKDEFIKGTGGYIENAYLFTSDKARINKPMNKMKSSFDSAKNDVTKREADADVLKGIKDNLTVISNMVGFCSFVVTRYIQAQKMNAKRITMLNKSKIYSEAANEPSDDIHGEEFNGDTLFDTMTSEDFNRTEWLDLSLTAENLSMKEAFDEFHKTMVINEALIFTDDEPAKIYRLQKIREAAAQEAEKKRVGIIERIKELIQKFLTKIGDLFSANSAFCKGNKAALDQDFQLRGVKSYGDILAGMYRVQQPITIKPFDFNTMGQVADKKEFFAKFIRNDLKKPSNYAKIKITQLSDDMDITTWCKAYYGYKVEKEKFNDAPFEFSIQELNANKVNMINFVSEVKFIKSTINKELNMITNESKKVQVRLTNVNQPGNNTNTRATTANQNQNTGNQNNGQQQNNSGQNTGARNESYYSSLYGAWITEADIEGGAYQNNGNATNNNNANGDPNIKKKDTDMAKAFAIYQDAYKDVITSQMTAAEFIASELMQILRAHVNGVNGKPINKNDKKNDNNQQQTQNNNQQQEPNANQNNNQ